MVYNLACNMGGMGFIENNHALCMLGVLINFLNLWQRTWIIVKTFFIVVVLVHILLTNKLEIKSADDQALADSLFYPADPETGYGWECLFNEILTQLLKQIMI